MTPLEEAVARALDGVTTSSEAGDFIQRLADGGYVIVPREPTAKMKWAGSMAVGDELYGEPEPSQDRGAANAYTAMITAALEG